MESRHVQFRRVLICAIVGMSGIRRVFGMDGSEEDNNIPKIDPKVIPRTVNKPWFYQRSSAASNRYV